METAAERFARDYESIGDDRPERDLAEQSEERLERLYVDEDGNSAAADFVAGLNPDPDPDPDPDPGEDDEEEG